MPPIPTHFQIDFQPMPNPSAVVEYEQARFTILTPRMIRIEYDPSGHFENRASQAVWYRDQPVPSYSHTIVNGTLVIDTEFLHLVYTGGVFTSENLSVELKYFGNRWRFGDRETGNLRGTGRTLDGADGPIALEKGLISRDGWSILDDSQSLVFDADCWLVGRQAHLGALDLYFLGYGLDYKACLEEYTRIAGPVPMIPRWALGNWWSRYWEFSQDELAGLMDDFQKHEIPLGVCIIDMDWHITKTGNRSSGWTGYTWNRELFPDPVNLLDNLHQKGLHVSLNLHPAEGIHPHEEQYAEIAERLGIDPLSAEPVEFDIANPEFVNAYLEVLHHPMEAKGIDFWWMDWQQGTQSKVAGLDPLWWLNHLHFYDLGRDGKKRSFVFSRWGGHGNQRYPIGFSGDSVVSWKSLSFQPYFTATAANVDYGWWSHDIGGHMRGVESGELYTRWVQFGVFSPILRLHSTKNMFQERRPWGYDAEVLRVAKDAMQLRHALIPYLYSMGWRYRDQAIPPILPMYYEYPAREEAYACPNQYYFGSELIAAPFTSRRDEETTLSRQAVWVPEGGSFGFFDGRFYQEGWHSIYGGLGEIPLFAKRGAIVPLAPKPTWGGLDNPAKLDVYAYAGADGKFDLYEDDGDSNAYLLGAYSLVPFRQSWDDHRLELTVGPAEGDLSVVPLVRGLRLHIRGVNRPVRIVVERNGAAVDLGWTYDAARKTVDLDELELAAKEKLVVSFDSDERPLMADEDDRLDVCRRLVSAFMLPSGFKENLYKALPEIVQDPTALIKFKVHLSDSQNQALAETLLQAGVELITSSGEELLVAWNRTENLEIRRSFSADANVEHWWELAALLQENGVQPKFSVQRIGKDFDRMHWKLVFQLAELADIRLDPDSLD